MNELNRRRGREGPMGRDPELWGAYVTHRRHARGRNIPFLITFEEWLAVWQESGHINERGNGRYVMSRPGDVGPYAVGNVRIILCGENVKESLARPGMLEQLRQAGIKALIGNKHVLGKHWRWGKSGENKISKRKDDVATFSTAEHWKFFAEFARWELAAGGPDPQLAMVNAMAAGCSGAEQVWRAGTYISVYNVAFAESLWRDWPWEKVEKHGKQLPRWLNSHWPKIVTRVERRCVRRPDWMAEFLGGYCKMARTYPELAARCQGMDPQVAYLHAWDTVTEVPRLGRYVALKLLEYWRRYCGLQVDAPDIRPRGGWSPRDTLARLWDRPEIAEKSDAPALLDEINKTCLQTLKRLRDDHDIKLDLFQLQVLLCEYRESWEGRRQYPGRSLDSELKYALKAEALWERKSEVWAARKQLFPHQTLGELNGWTGPREGPANALADYKYTWSDLRYDFHATTDWSRPAVWGTPRPDPATKIEFQAKVKVPRIYEIVPGMLYQSARWHQLDLEAQRALAQQYKLDGIVNLWRDDPRLARAVSWYCWWPLRDGKRISAADVTEIAVRAAQFCSSGKRLLTTCYGGRNRSGLLSALVVQRLQGCSGREAVELVKQGRPGALVNPHFVAFLQRERAGGQLGLFAS
jgi:Alpha-glutamyl/putrescinyl thymine pyrophosphorylase clade 2